MTSLYMVVCKKFYRDSVGYCWESTEPMSLEDAREVAQTMRGYSRDEDLAEVLNCKILDVKIVKVVE